MKNTMNRLDSGLSLVLIISTVATIYSLMASIYGYSLINQMNSSAQLKIFIDIYAINVVIQVIETVVTALIFGSTNAMCAKLTQVLDEINSNHLSEPEFKELLLFFNVCRDSRIGFTIGGLAPIDSKTLLAVNNCNDIQFNEFRPKAQSVRVVNTAR